MRDFRFKSQRMLLNICLKFQNKNYLTIFNYETFLKSDQKLSFKKFKCVSIKFECRLQEPLFLKATFSFLD